MRERVLQGEFTRIRSCSRTSCSTSTAASAEIDDALSAYGQRRAYRAAAEPAPVSSSTHVVFVHGDAGSVPVRHGIIKPRRSTRRTRTASGGRSTGRDGNQGLMTGEEVPR